VRLDSMTVSRRYAELFEDATGAWRVRDLGSRNGILVNGNPVEGERPLAARDRLQVGKFH
jgi:pSer/pThr/pTyr-binding forkhead associated (FHA) protein